MKFPNPLLFLLAATYCRGMLADDDLTNDDMDRGSFSSDQVVDFGETASHEENDSPLAVSTDAHMNGTWSNAASTWPLVPIHMVLLPNGHVLSYGTNSRARRLGFFYDVFDPSLGLANANAHQTLPTATETNIFCSGQVVLPSTGEVLITGGSQKISGKGNFGVTHSQLFDPLTKELTFTRKNMHIARWYPTLTTLKNGRVLVQGGLDDVRNATLTPEVYNLMTGKWNLLTGAKSAALYKRGYFYPRSYATSNGQVILFQRAGTRGTNKIWKLDPSGKGSLEVVGTVPGPGLTEKTPAVMYDVHKVLLIIGGKNAVTIDISNSSAPIVRNTGSLREDRWWSDAVALPTGEVLVSGGASIIQSEENAVKYNEIWSPETGEWRVTGAGLKSRLYHSAALLLPDGTVLVGGGGPPGQVINQNAEIYEPPYLFQENGEFATRPVITNIQEDVGYGEVVQVDFANATNIARVSLIRTGSVTHSYNMDERMRSLPFKQSKTTSLLQVKFSGGPNSMPPGYYMLFVLDTMGVPSVSKIVHLS